MGLIQSTQIMEGLRLGTVELGVVHEGGVSGVYRPFNIFSMPYMFQSHAHAYAVLDGPFGKELGEDLKKKTGIRLMAYADTAGCRRLWPGSASRSRRRSCSG
ncbi:MULTISPECIES: hypothetical protein [Variovorax]|uniref:TRAP-type C4-dicarboxylate transport system substrate-binding protein n=1 Tax=Variovorax paradoxus TaxID=34073 RepID=A0AAW8EPZ3_VARPD|nr:hypothetical protein [Variovorax paradoxus]MDP9974922.1 TRAP-type C4-dicarboxylate transport system substrate-binding protein [Variovorax paradoxus]